MRKSRDKDNPTAGKRRALAAAVNILCLAVTVIAASVSIACAAFGICSLQAGYPTFGERGYFYVGEEGVPDRVDGETLLIFVPCEGSAVARGDAVIYGGVSGARAGVCLRNDAGGGRLVLNTPYGVAVVSYSAVTGRVAYADEGAGKFIGALSRSYPASAVALGVFAAAITAITAVLAVKRRRRAAGKAPSRRNSERGDGNASSAS